MRNVTNAVTHNKDCGEGEGKMAWPESDDKKRIAAHKRDISATGGGQGSTSVSSKDDRIAAVTGETSMKGIRQTQRRWTGPPPPGRENFDFFFAA